MSNLKMLGNRIEMLQALNLEGKVCVEVGVAYGDFTEEILKCRPAYLHCIDPWIHQNQDVYPHDHANVNNQEFEQIYEHVVKKFEKYPTVHLHRMFSQDAVELFEDVDVDFAYIDAIHTFESCLCDITAWYHKVKPGGWICGHDYTGGYVGVKAAVDAFSKIIRKPIGLITLEPWGSWGIQR